MELFLDFSRRIWVFQNLSVLTPIVPLYANLLGATEALIRVIIGSFPAAAMVVRINIAPYVYQRSKLFLVLGTIVCVLSPLMYLLSTSPLELIIARIVHGTGMALFTLSTMTLVANMTLKSRLGEVVGVYGFFVAVSQVLGPLIGGVLEEMQGVTGVFYVASGFALLSLFSGALIKIGKSSSLPLSPSIRIYKTILRDRNVQLASIGIFVLTCSYGALMAYGPLYLQKGGLSTTYIRVFFILAVGSVIGRPTMGKLSDTKGRIPVSITFMIIATLSIYVLSAVLTMNILFLGVVAYGIGFGASYAVQSAQVIDTIDQDQRSSALAIFTAFFDVGTIFGSIILGLITETASFGYPGLFQMAAVIILMGLGIISYMGWQQK